MWRDDLSLNPNLPLKFPRELPVQKSLSPLLQKGPFRWMTCPFICPQVETDAPDQMPPESYRPSVLTGPTGSLLNVPANLAAIHAGLAALIGKPLESLTGQLAGNFDRLFGVQCPGISMESRDVEG
jgi:hypothetical protein